MCICTCLSFLFHVLSFQHIVFDIVMYFTTNTLIDDTIINNLHLISHFLSFIGRHLYMVFLLTFAIYM